MRCSFCEDQQIKDRVIIENNLAFAFPTNAPIVPGHTLICPKRRIKYFEESTRNERYSIEEIRYKLKVALRQVFEAEGFNYAFNEESVGGQSVSHFHLHIVPRKEGDEGVYSHEPREFLYRPGPRSVATPDDELKEVVSLIKKAF